MDYRRYSRWAEWGVAIVVAGLQAWLFLWPSPFLLSGFPLGVVLRDAQWMSGISLVLAWALLGPGWRWVRGASVPAAAVLFFGTSNVRTSPAELESLFVVSQCSAAVVFLLCLVRLGLQVRYASEIRPERPAQFSLRSMLLATTLIAMAIGLLEILRPSISSATIQALLDLPGTSRAPIGSQIRELILGTSAALTTIGSVWVALRPGAVWLRALAGSLILLMTSLYLAHLTEGTESGFNFFAMHFVIAFFAIALLSGATALPLRLMGYRLQTSPE